MRYSTYKVHVAGVPKLAVGVLHELVAYSEHISGLTLNRMSLEKFRKLVNLSKETTRADIVLIMSQCGKVVASIKEFEQAGTRRKEVLSGSWPVFQYISVTPNEVIFEVCPLMWEDRADRYRA